MVMESSKQVPAAGFTDGSRSFYYIGLGDSFSQKLLAWYRRCARDLPWRNTTDPYAIWVSEIMLQQTRAAVVIPYYHRFLERFPNNRALAEAPEQDVLACWAGLGYYSRARNLQRAAQAMAGKFPDTYVSIRALPGVGDYTAAAVASIAFGLPHAALDGNVLRVMSRVTAEAGDIGATVTRVRLREATARLLDCSAPGEFNQAMMELGATVCLPKSPLCRDCPVSSHCEAVKSGLETQLPLKVRRQKMVRLRQTLLLLERDGKLLMWQRPSRSRRMPGFWELPESGQLSGVRVQSEVGAFRHTITHHLYSFTVVRATVRGTPKGFEWFKKERLATLPLSTIAHKALRIWNCEI